MIRYSEKSDSPDLNLLAAAVVVGQGRVRRHFPIRKGGSESKKICERVWEEAPFPLPFLHLIFLCLADIQSKPCWVGGGVDTRALRCIHMKKKARMGRREEEKGGGEERMEEGNKVSS